jgi:putative glutamine amidotransferase
VTRKGLRRPVIGIAGYCEPARWDIWDCQATLIQQSYVRGITEHGGRVVVLPPDDVDADVLDRLDGLLLPSGADIDPALYAEPRHSATDRARLDRDAGELLLLREALARNMPVLGVCRGMQLLAVATGGSLHQHLPETLGHTGHLPQEGVLGEHEVRFVPGSLAANLFGERASLNSHHHQAIAHPGAMVATAHSIDGVIEAVEQPAAGFVLGVQWHPEIAGGDKLFAAFVSACVSAEAGLLGGEAC